MFFNWPSGTTWRLLGSFESNPTKQPTVFLVSSEEIEGEGVATMFLGTRVRKGWPLARKFDASKVMDKGELLSASRPSPITSTAAFLLKLGAIEARAVKVKARKL